MKKTMVVLAVLGLALPAVANDPPEWEDPRLDRIEDAVAELERRARTGRASDEPGVAMRHGHVRMVADLARVDVVLEIENPSDAAIQWQRSFEIDPASELIGATLERGSGLTIEARTLTLAGARRIYDEVSRPRPTVTRTRVRGTPWSDPLRLERPGGQRLDVAVWPIEAGETVKVHLDFVAPLHGRGRDRVYRDVIQSDLGGTNEPPRANGNPVITPGDTPPTPAIEISMDTDWLIHPGALRVLDEPVGMLYSETVGGVYHYVAARGGSDRVPTLPLETPGEPDHRVLAISGGLTSRVAIWRFDPVEFARAYRLDVPEGATLHLVGRPGSTYRIAPHVFGMDDDPRPVTCRLSRRSTDLRYAVEVRLADGTLAKTVAIQREVHRESLPRDLEGAITGWHRAMLVQRVLAWGRAGDADDAAKALEYAVDMGVLAEGTAALAVPDEELSRIPRRSQREYRRDGVPLGAQGGEADFEAPPPGSVSR